MHPSTSLATYKPPRDSLSLLPSTDSLPYAELITQHIDASPGGRSLSPVGQPQSRFNQDTRSTMDSSRADRSLTLSAANIVRLDDRDEEGTWFQTYVGLHQLETE